MGSPYATGGGGTTLEHRVAAVWLARLLTGQTTPEIGPDRRVTRVAFQQGPDAAVDDIVVWASRPDESQPGLRLAIAVRRDPDFVASDEKTAKLVGSLVLDLRRMRDKPDGVQQRLAIAVAAHHPQSTEVAELASLARDQHEASGFFSLVEHPGRFRRKLRERLAQLERLVAAASAHLDGVEACDPAVARDTTWELLRELHVTQMRVEAPDLGDLTAAQNALVPLARGEDLTGAESLLNRMLGLASGYVPAAAVVDAALLGRNVDDLLKPGITRSHIGWSVLEDLDVSAHGAVRQLITAPSGQTWRLDRGPEIGSLLDLADEFGVIMVTGESGVGKSSLAVAAADHVRQHGRAGQRAESTCIDLKDLPPVWVEFQGLLGASLGDLLAQMSAPHRYLVVDAADAADTTAVLRRIVEATDTASVRLILVTPEDGRDAVSRIVCDRFGVVDAAQIEVAGLDDDAIDDLVAAVPGLVRLARSSRSRELLRRLVVVDLLLRAHVSQTPLDAAAAMEAIWRGLVRNAGSHERGVPVGRDRVMLQLAERELGLSSPGEPDAEALDGLCRDGLVREGQSVWQPHPRFAHDEVRRYAVARWLIAEENVGAAILRAEAPRWALGAALLAAQLDLARPDGPTAGRLTMLQKSFDTVAANHGPRWADVPGEALLELADPEPQLTDAAPMLLEDDAAGLRRLLRLLSQRHTGPDGRADARVVEPVASVLLTQDRPWAIVDGAAKLLRGWLGSLVDADTAPGHPKRLLLAQRLAAAVAAGDQRLIDQRAEHERAVAEQTPQQREHARLIQERRAHLLASPLGLGRSRRSKPELPRELTDERVLELLALLGPDLGEEGKRLLGRVASDAPDRLWPALELPGTGRALASLGPGLLATLTEAYYLDDEEEEEDEWAARPYDERVRDHRVGGPLSGPLRGPFLHLFASDFDGGVAMLNRLLDHATRVRGRIMGDLQADLDLDGAQTDGLVVEVSGVRRSLRGDDNVWRWYRGTGAGSYPSMSALQALERVCDERLRLRPCSLEGLVAQLLDGCENAAMAGLVVGLLVRHVESAGALLDPFLTEPQAWHLETRRVTAERTSSWLTADPTGTTDPERRTWSLREAALLLAARARTPTEVERLAEVGRRLVDRARQISGHPEYVATVRTWAAFLDRATFRVDSSDGQAYVTATRPADATEVLADSDADLRRGLELGELCFRYLTVDNPRYRKGPAPDDVEVQADLERAQGYLLDPPRQAADSPREAAATLASYAVRRLTDRTLQLDEPWRRFAVEVVLRVVEGLPDQDLRGSHATSSELDAEWQVARVLGAMLAADPDALRDEAGEPARSRVLAAGHRLARSAAMETRLVLVVGLEAAWLRRCTGDAGCVHLDALDWAIESMRDCVMGPWEGHARPIWRLGDPVEEALAAVADQDIHVGHLVVLR